MRMPCAFGWMTTATSDVSKRTFKQPEHLLSDGRDRLRHTAKVDLGDTAYGTAKYTDCRGIVQWRDFKADFPRDGSRDGRKGKTLTLKSRNIIYIETLRPSTSFPNCSCRCSCRYCVLRQSTRLSADPVCCPCVDRNVLSFTKGFRAFCVGQGA